MGYQFAHLETYARKPDSSGRSTKFVFDEAARHLDASQHVCAPTEPVVIFGVPVEEARAIHDQRAADAKTEAAGKTRSIRSDQHTLFTVVASFPTPWEELRGNDEHFSALTDWERRTVGWLKEQYGSQLVTVIRHDDERFPHIHAFVLDTGPSLRAKNLHPGHRAKTEAAANARANGANAKEANAIGDAAYKKAMRSWQDSYWSNVGLPCGLARLGPSRRRLTRSEWQTEKAAARNTAVLIQRAEQSKQAAAKVMNDAHARHQIAADREAVAIAATERAEGHDQDWLCAGELRRPRHRYPGGRTSSCWMRHCQRRESHRHMAAFEQAHDVIHDVFVNITQPIHHLMQPQENAS